MKKCPYCAEMIQDEAIKCRYCHSDLREAPDEAVPSGGTTPDQSTTSESSPEPVPEPSPELVASSEPMAHPEPTQPEPVAASPSAADTASVRYTHSGYRYVLGYSADAFGIWDRQSPSAPAERFPRTDDGWRDAWLRFAALEPNHVEVAPGGSPAPTTATAGGTAAAGTTTQDNDALQYTHSGRRYLLGYGQTFFGIWDRQAPNTPVERFSRDDAGWAAAWTRYTTLETHFVEVGLGSSGSAGSPA